MMLEASLVLLAAALTAMFARDIYFLQREYELVIARYLDNGIDKVLAELDEITAAFNHNWSQIIILLRNFDDAGEGFDLDQLKTDFLRVNFSGLNAVAHYRIRVLVGNNEYWAVYQKALAYYAQANSVFTSEIPEVVRLKVAGHPSVAHQTVRDVVEAGMNEAKDEYDRGVCYFSPIQELQLLSTELESKRMNFKSLEKFKDIPAVVNSRERIHAMLTDEAAQRSVASDPSSATLQSGG